MESLDSEIQRKLAQEHNIMSTANIISQFFKCIKKILDLDLRDNNTCIFHSAEAWILLSWWRV